MNICECGCGQECKKRYVQGHVFKKNKKDGSYIAHNRMKLFINGQYIIRSRYVMEQHIGRALTKNDIVHHINENLMDDRIENLQLMTRSEHQSYHMAGEKHPLFGKEISDETRLKLSIAKIGRKLSEETKKKLSIAHKGKIISEAQKKMISLVHKGKIISGETRKKISDTKKRNKEIMQNNINQLIEVWGRYAPKFVLSK